MKGPGMGKPRKNPIPRILPDTIPYFGFLPDIFRMRKKETIGRLTKEQKRAASNEFKGMVKQSILDPLVRKSSWNWIPYAYKKSR